MAESTQAETPVEQGPPSAESFEELLQKQFGEPSPQPTKQAETPEQDAVTDQDDGELTLEDIPDDEKPTQSANGDEFEIVHNGQQVKLSRAETIKLAQQGFDYDRKTQHVAEQRKAVEATLQKAAAIEQLVPLLAQDLAQVKAIEAQLQQYGNVDWIKLATDDPLEYPKWRAQYDQLNQAWQSANQNLNHKASVLHQEKAKLTAEALQHESQLLVERIPEWKDPAKRDSGVRELRNFLLKEGASEADIDGLNSSLQIAIARKAMLYDRLKGLKAEKSKQLRAAPPVVKPGAAVSDQGRTSFKTATQTLRKMGQKGQHSAQEALFTAMLGKTFK